MKFRKMLPITHFWLAASLIATNTLPAQALTLSFEAGIDEKTRHFLDSLPANVRENVILALQDALPLIDKSIFAYIDKVDDVMTKQLNQMRCQASGVVAATGDDFKSLFGKVEPLSKLQADESRTFNSFGASESPEHISGRYADLLYRATVKRCEVNLDKSSVAQADYILDHIRPKWQIWYNLQGRCADAEDCYRNLRSSVDGLLTQYGTDIPANEGRSQLQNVSDPAPKGFLARMDRVKAETTIGQLEKIENAIKLRVKLADAVSGLAQKIIDKMGVDYDQIEINSKVPNNDLCQRAVSIRDAAQTCQNNWNDFGKEREEAIILRKSFADRMNALDNASRPKLEHCNIVIGQETGAVKSLCP